MPIAKLVPNVERRLSAWIGVQEGLDRESRRKPRFTITISRQFGCEGYPLAESLKASLDQRTGELWTVFDKTLIELVSRETHLSERLLGNIGDESHILDALASTVPGWRSHREAYEVLARYIVRIAREGNAIVVGRGGALIAQNLPNCFHFRLEAPREHRIESIQQRLGVGRQEAEALVVEHERGRERFIQRFLHSSVADTSFYNAVFNTAKNSVERITRSVLELIPIAADAGRKPPAGA
jgi:hypothetical protein